MLQRSMVKYNCHRLKYLVLYYKRVIVLILKIIMLSVNFFCNISSYDIKELYSVDILCKNSTSTMPVSRGEGWVFSCLSSYI